MKLAGVFLFFILVTLSLVMVPRQGSSSDLPSGESHGGVVWPSPAVTVRSLRAWNQLPQEFVPTLLAFRAAGIDLLPMGETELRTLARSIAEEPENKHYDLLPILVSLTDYLAQATLDAHKAFQDSTNILGRSAVPDLVKNASEADERRLGFTDDVASEATCVETGIFVAVANVQQLALHSGSDSIRCSALLRDNVVLEVHLFKTHQQLEKFRGWVEYGLYVNELQRIFAESTGAREYPHPLITWSQITSSLEFLRSRRIAPVIFANRSGTEGVLYYRVSVHVHVFFKVQAPETLNWENLLQDISVKAMASSWQERVRFEWLPMVFHIGVIGFPVASLGFVAIPSRFRRRFLGYVDRLRNVGLGLWPLWGFWLVVVLLGVAVYGFTTPGFSIFAALTILLLIVSMRSLKRRVSRPLVLVGEPKNKVYWFKIRWVKHHVTDEISNPTYHMWKPNQLVCYECGLKYELYTPKVTGFGQNVSTEEEMKKAMGVHYVEVEKAVREESEIIVNGCPRCGGRSHLGKEMHAELVRRTRRDLWVGMGFLGFGIAGLGVAWFLDGIEFFDSFLWGVFLEFVCPVLPFEICDISVADALMLGGLLLVTSLHMFFYLVFRKRFVGLWVCVKEGLFFEKPDLRPGFVFEPICPSCTEPLSPIGDVKGIRKKDDGS